MKRASIRRNAAFNSAGLLAELAGTALLVPYLIAALGVEAYGLITSVISIAIIAQMLAQSALVVTIRQIAALHGSLGAQPPLAWELRATRTSSVSLAGLSLVGVALVLIYEDSLLTWLGVDGELRAEGHRSLRLLCWLLPLMVSSSLFPAILRGREQFALANGIKAASVLLRVGAVFAAFALWGASITTFVVIRCGSAVLEGIVAAAATVRTRSARRAEGLVFPEKESTGGTLRESGVLLSYSVGNLLVLEVAKLLIGGLFDLTALGVFGAASAAASLVARLGQAVASVFTPAISGLEGAGKAKQSAELMKRGTTWTAIVMSGLTVAIMPAWKGLAGLWLGPSLAHWWLVLGVVFAGQGLVSAVSPAVFSAYGRGKVLGVSLIHLGFNAASLAVGGIATKTGMVGLVGFAVILAAFRGIGASLNFAYVARHVFEIRGGRFLGNVIGSLGLASVLALLSSWFVESQHTGAVGSIAVGAFSLLVFFGVAWQTLRKRGSNSG